MSDLSPTLEDQPAPGSNLTEYTVSELAFNLKRTVEDTYGLVRVRGELSGIKRAGSGHLYFALKDDRAVLDGVCWRGSQRRLSVELEDGLEVICTGQLSTYPARSRYQLIVETIEPAGVGALMALLEERRKTFEAEGLFDDARKRPLPFLPKTIGIITSPSGAVIRDILHRLEERFPCHVLLWPVMVQGDGAAKQIAAAIDGFSQWREIAELPRPDLLILARGGGSIEDLWSFNEETVVRAVSRCSIPLISAVGHETDTTLVDHAADRRAPTPTAAAEIAVPVRSDLLHMIGDLDERLLEGLDRFLSQRQDYLRGLGRGLPDPDSLVGISQQRADELGDRHHRAIGYYLERLGLQARHAGGSLRAPVEILRDHERRLEISGDRAGAILRDLLRSSQRDWQRTTQRLQATTLHAQIEAADKSIHGLDERLHHVAHKKALEWQRGLNAVAAMLESLSHRRVLERGYALVRSAESAYLIPTADEARREASLLIEFADGELAVQTAMETGPEASARPKSGRSKPRHQGELF